MSKAYAARRSLLNRFSKRFRSMSWLASCFQRIIRDIEKTIGEGKNMSCVAWKSLFCSTDYAGLGFHDLYSFNMAMLAKQAWRLVMNPESLLARPLKACYYPQRDFWSAMEAHPTLAIWRSIAAARPVLDCCIRMRIGNGRSTANWGHPWLSGKGNLFLFTPRPISLATRNRVSDILDPLAGSWNTSIVQEMFWLVDNFRILSTPVSGEHVEDRLFWSLS
ncbi:hypothetical protein ABFS83_05G081600 [Erythranthe nasuta]